MYKTSSRGCSRVLCAMVILLGRLQLRSLKDAFGNKPSTTPGVHVFLSLIITVLGIAAFWKDRLALVRSSTETQDLFRNVPPISRSENCALRNTLTAATLCLRSSIYPLFVILQQRPVDNPFVAGSRIIRLFLCLKVFLLFPTMNLIFFKLASFI